ncbi:MAG TPA: hypothetical protein PLP62_14135 [Flavobacteriaceae bacterium]|nr:hypothetical protein [Alteromonas sp.]HPF12588.1 hypothetical protein [Flavobacteriaceae bacterium]
MVTIIHSVQEIALPLFPFGGRGALGVGTPISTLGFPTAPQKGKVASVLDAT